VSKAFTKDDDGAGEVLVVPRAPLPPGVPNYVTRRGLDALQAELTQLERERAILEGANESDRAGRLLACSQRLAVLQSRIAAAVWVDPTSQPQDEVRFGATVRVRNEAGSERDYEIVGVDEAQAELGKIAFSAPLARALSGKRTGDIAVVHTPRAEEELEVLAVCYRD